MSKKINIVGLKEVNDPFYRYQMRKLDVVAQRNTVAVKNIEEVASDINIDYNILIKYFKRVFGTNFVYKNGSLTTTKAISYNEFDNSLKVFIENFILCQTCRLPETNIIIDKNGLYLKCRCCPNTTKVINKNKIMADTIDDIINLYKK